MKVKQLMKSPVVCVHPEESVAVAARTLARYNIGILPVCEASGPRESRRAPSPRDAAAARNKQGDWAEGQEFKSLFYSRRG